MFFCRALSWYCSSSFSETTDLISYIRVWEDSDLFLRVSKKEQFLYVSYRWKCLWFKNAKVYIWHSFVVDSKTQLSQAKSMNFSDKVSIKTFFSITGLFMEMFGCVFDQKFLRPWRSMSTKLAGKCSQSVVKYIPSPSTKKTGNSTNTNFCKTCCTHVNDTLRPRIFFDNCVQKRYVVSMYRSLVLFACNWHVSYTCNSGVLFQTGTELLRNKRINICFPTCVYKSFESAVFKSNLCLYI